jgi:hypothetical protein
LDKFDGLLLRVIDKNIRYILGDINAGVIYDYLKKKGCAFQEIPAKPNTFSMVIRNMLGSGRGQVLGAAPILEEAILEALYAELKIKFDRQSATSFGDHIKKLKKVYNNEGRQHSTPLQQRFIGSTRERAATRSCK